MPDLFESAQSWRLRASVLYWRVPRLIEELRVAHGDGSYIKFLKTIAKAALIVLDDWGLTALSTQDRADLLEILDDRVNLGSTLISRFFEVRQRTRFLLGVRCCSRCCDRIRASEEGRLLRLGILALALYFANDLVDRRVSQNTAPLGRIITLAALELLQKTRHPNRTQSFQEGIDSSTSQSASVALPPSIGSIAAFMVQ